MSSQRLPMLPRSTCVLLAAFALGLLVEPAVPGRVAEAAKGTMVSACGGTTGCPSKIVLGAGLDTLMFHAELRFPTRVDPPTQKLTLELSNQHGVLVSAKLPRGSFQPIDAGFQFRNRDARRAGGVSRVTLRRFDKRTYRIDVIAHGDLSAATFPRMTLRLKLGNDKFATENLWSGREFGWLLHLPATPTPPTPSATPQPTATPTPQPTATPTPQPTATPSPTASPTATPMPTVTPGATATPQPTATPAPTPAPTATPAPTLEPYGSVSRAFVSRPESLLR